MVVDPETSTRRTRRIRGIRLACAKCGSACSGLLGAWSGPAIFLLKGKKAPVGLDPAYLVKHGGAPGGDVHMTQTAYMSKGAWEGGGVGSGDGNDEGG
jgi:hypothetical protein